MLILKWKVYNTNDSHYLTNGHTKIFKIQKCWYIACYLDLRLFILYVYQMHASFIFKKTLKLSCQSHKIDTRLIPVNDNRICKVDWINLDLDFCGKFDSFCLFVTLIFVLLKFFHKMFKYKLHKMIFYKIRT